MRVLHIDTGRAMRGGQWQVFLLLKGLARAGHDCLLLAPAGSALLGKVQRAGLRAEPLSWPRLLRRSREYDVVHAHTSSAHRMGALLAPAKMVVSRRVAFPLRSDVFSKLKYSRAALYLAVSTYVQGLMIHGGVAQSRIRVVYDAAPLLPQAKPSSRIVAVETRDPQKGTDILEEAARHAGFEVHYSSALDADVADAGMLVYLTRTEGLGSGALVAMSAGVPVIASRVGGLVEVVEHGVTGLLVENDPRAVAEAVAELRADPERAREMGRKGREVVQSKFSVEKMCAETVDGYREVLG